jgi:hypothetical protein
MTENKDDAVIERVRSARQRIVKRCGGDVHRMRKWAERLETRHRGLVAGFETAAKARRSR